MDKKAMFKEAAQLLRDQNKQIHELQEKIARAEKAEAIVRKLVDSDELLADEVFKKLGELRSKPLSELELMEKAAELYKSSFTIGLGKLSNQDDSSSNPLLDFLFNEA
jgi:hypothetical protein